MERRAFLASLAAATAPAVAQGQSQRPNVLIFLADDLGWNDVGYHGSEIQTPNIDRLAAEGTQLDRFYSFPLCSPTRSALMTGRYPLRLGLGYTVVRPWARFGLPLTERTIADYFQEAGYETAMTGKWHLGHYSRKYLPAARGFGHSYGQVNGAIDYYTHERDGGLDWHRDGKTLKEDGYTTDLIASEAERLIRGRDRSKPMFLYVPFNAPHGPLQAPKELLAKYAHIEDQKRRTFAAMVDRMDTAIGGVLAALDKEGMRENTVVLFFSDNGGPIGSGARNKPLRGAKGSTWEGGTRVPAVIRFPGKVPAKKTLAQVMTVMDVLPTLAEAAGQKPRYRNPLDGKSVWSGIRSGTAAAREDIFFSIESERGLHFAVHRDKGGEQWKLVREIGTKSSSINTFLFRIDRDATESHDLASQHPALVDELVTKLEAWRKLAPAESLRHTTGPGQAWKSPAAWVDGAEP
ncbi:MAG TPA: arylsulfatase [Bryobacteraceae bacterium]|nr:arylsulfatase [Bryobacteraceae bacterium]